MKSHGASEQSSLQVLADGRFPMSRFLFEYEKEDIGGAQHV